MASPGNQHCARCIGTLSFPMTAWPLVASINQSVIEWSSCGLLLHMTCSAVSLQSCASCDC